ncbi:MAG: PD-(D/E)XK nuclease family protein [Endomicrobium sp.]|jgi:CRISPR/Cas system-associated exonuclease Cas4 (RecB family)|nr:PD-(D/E)XK nuclease family protein [Endomicrobium sp.]
MSGKIINIDVASDIINFTADYIFKSSKKIALINGGKRPFLFLKKKLSKKHSAAFFAPEYFTNDEFIEKIIFDNTELTKISDFEAAFVIFEIVKAEMPQLLNGNFSFASFMEWSFEIVSFIEQLDLENVTEEKLKAIKANAEIGYDAPENINNLLKNIFKIRKRFHDILEKSSQTTKGYSFLKALSIEDDILVGYFDEIILMAPFYLHKTEIEVFKKLYNNKRLTIFIQGNPKEYEVLEKLYFEFGETVPDIKSKNNEYKLNVYSAFDDQSQGALLKNLIKSYRETDLDKAVIIVPDSLMLQSVISEISIVTDRYNVSAGYPAAKTAIFSLLQAIINAQLSRRGQLYYSKDVMKVLSNPLLKNMRFFGESSISRIVAHKIEKALDQDSKSRLSGKMFISFEEIINQKQLIDEISLTIAQDWEYLPAKKIVKILNEIFESSFVSWEKIDSFYGLSSILSVFLEKIYSFSAAGSYPLNIEAMEILLSLSKELKFGKVSQIKFQNDEIFNIFKKLIKNKRIALTGSPLKGLQILGFLEARNLSFDNVFIVGMKDSAIPAIKKDYCLVPKDVMYALGLEMTKKEYKIQQYHFNRIISGAKNLNLIYPDNDKDERSRFIESIIWNRQLENKDINAVKISKFVLPKFQLRYLAKRKYAKTQEIKKFLKNMFYTYSKIDTYLDCKLKFYFRYVLLLKEGLNVGQELSGSDIGSFVHNFLKNALYENLTSKELHSLEFEKEYFKKLKDNFDSFASFKFREDSFMIREVLMHRMKNILYYERQRQYQNIYSCEKKYVSKITTSAGETYNLSCIIDRIDVEDNEYMIFDYKTGITNEKIIQQKHFDLLSDNFDRQNIKKAIKSLQPQLYKYIFEKETELVVSKCGIYDVKKAKINELPQECEIYEKCIDVIKQLLIEINSGENFEFDKEDTVNCKTCKYFYICR